MCAKVPDVELPDCIRLYGRQWSKSVAAAAVLLSNARFPVIVTGEGVIFSEGVEASKKLAEKLSAPVCCNYQHNDALPGRHPWS